MLYPGASYAFEADVTVEDNLSIAEGRALLTSIAFAGYMAITVHAEGITVAFVHWLPGPPRPDDAPDLPPGVFIDARDGLTVRPAIVPALWNDPERGDSFSVEPRRPRDVRGPESFWERCGPPHDADAPSLEIAVAEVCKVTCPRLDIMVAESARLSDALRVLVRAGNVSSRRFEGARFIAVDPCADPPHEEVPPMTADAKDYEVTVKSLSLDFKSDDADAGSSTAKTAATARAVVHAALPRVLACCVDAATYPPPPGSLRAIG